MRFFRLFIAAWPFAGAWLAALPAHAAGSLTVVKQPNWENRLANRKVDLLNRKDCIDDATASFGITVSGVSSAAVLELWAGTGCDQVTNRTGATKTCVQVTASTVPKTGVITARFQNMVKPYGTAIADEGTPASCDLEASTGLTTRSLYFVVYNTGSTMSEITQTPTWAFKYDIRAPAPPTNVTASGGEESLTASFTAPANEFNLLSYKLYCSPLGSLAPTAAAGTAGTAAADVGGTAGTDTGGTAGTGTAGTGETAGTSGNTGNQTPTGCQSDILVPGKPAPAGAIDCGTVGAQGAKSGSTSQGDLQNGVTYAIAIAAEDTANNIGVLSQLACSTPANVTGFYEAYRQAGGEAGGGFCSYAPPRRGSASLLGAMLIGACALIRRRR